MSASRNSKTRGLRYLWIPGRKRSHPKGRFDSTHKHVSYNSGQKKNEPWSIGGNKGFKDIIKSEGETIDSGGGPSISSFVPLSCAAGAPTIAIAADNMPALTESKQNKCALLENMADYGDLPMAPKNNEHKETNCNNVTARELLSDSASHHNLRKIDEDFELDDLPIPPIEQNLSDISSEPSPRKKRPSTNKKINGNHHPEVDIHSIESMSECKHSYSTQDLPDSATKASQLNETLNKKNKNPDEDEENEKVVKCLYYTLMCCECTIS